MAFNYSKKLAAIDLDGTLLNSNGLVSDITRAVLNEWRRIGNYAVIVTARPLRSVRRIVDLITAIDMVICSNGTMAFNADTNTISKSNYLNMKAISPLCVQLRREIPSISFGLELGTSIICDKSFPPDDSPLDEVTFMDPLLCSNEQGLKLIAHHGSFPIHELAAKCQQVLGNEVSITRSTDLYLEMSAPGISKATALAAYSKELAINQEDVVAFGDMYNDLPMLQWAGISVAMMNACDEVKTNAHWITASNDEDGVALVLQGMM